MGYFLPEHRRGVRCVFSMCEHAPATKTYHHEFANYPPKPMCDMHAAQVEKATTPKRKKGQKRNG